MKIEIINYFKSPERKELEYLQEIEKANKKIYNILIELLN